MTVFLYPNRIKDKEFAIAGKALQELRKLGIPVWMDSAFEREISGENIRFAPQNKGIAASDAVITIGGDGTLLAAAPACVQADKPVFGVNLGRVGFLAACEQNELSAKLSLLAAGDYHVEKHLLLEGATDDAGWHATALNDIVLFGEDRLHPMDYSIYCDNSFVCRYRSDGVIAATPTGSTAYSFSAGGPILDASAPVFEINGICAQQLRSAPMVFSAERRLRIVAEAENRGAVYICADSHNKHRMEPGSSVTIQVSGKKLKRIAFGGAEQFEAIEAKLLRR